MTPWRGSPRRCALCGAVFEPGSPRHRFCSGGCKAEAHQIQRSLRGLAPGARWPYRSLAHRLAADLKPGSPISRLLKNADRLRQQRTNDG